MVKFQPSKLAMRVRFPLPAIYLSRGEKRLVFQLRAIIQRPLMRIWWSPSFGQVLAENLVLACSAVVWHDKELLYPSGLMWLSPGLFVGAYPFGPVPLSLCSWAMAPMVKATKPTATAAATFVSIDSFICFFLRLFPRSIGLVFPIGAVIQRPLTRTMVGFAAISLERDTSQGVASASTRRRS
jgi:hypothetical protein